jgi:hypothetical protein
MAGATRGPPYRATSDPNETQRFLRDVLGYLTGSKQNGLLDFGGGDVSLAKLIDLMPTMADDMVVAGVHPVAVNTGQPISFWTLLQNKSHTCHQPGFAGDIWDFLDNIRRN